MATAPTVQSEAVAASECKQALNNYSNYSTDASKNQPGGKFFKIPYEAASNLEDVEVELRRARSLLCCLYTNYVDELKITRDENGNESLPDCWENRMILFNGHDEYTALIDATFDKIMHQIDVITRVNATIVHG